MNRSLLGVFAAAVLFLAPGAAFAQEKLPVVATLPYLGEIVKIIGGDLVDVNVIAPPGTDPHSITTTPKQTIMVGKAKLFVESGMQLEGWAQRLRDAAKNDQIQPGKAGHVYATNGLVPVEVPTQAQIDEGGHVHAAGNPHIWLDPINLKVIAKNIDKALAAILYEKTAVLTKNRLAFEKKLDEAMFGPELVKIMGSRLEKYHRTRTLLGWLEKNKNRKLKGKPLGSYVGGWMARAQKLGKLKMVTYHKTWSYFEDAFGFTVVGTIEEKPGIPASPAHLDRLKNTAKKSGVRIVVSPPYYPSKTVEGVATQIKGVARILPTQPGETENADDLIAMFDRIFDLLESAAKSSGA